MLLTNTIKQASSVDELRETLTKMLQDIEATIGFGHGNHDGMACARVIFVLGVHRSSIETLSSKNQTTPDNPIEEQFHASHASLSSIDSKMQTMSSQISQRCARVEKE